MDRDDVISTLNDLIETCQDGIDGFRAAADHVKSARAKDIFLARLPSIERGKAELEEAVRRLGGEPARGGSATGAMHRGWMDVKSAVTGKDDDAIIAEAERGERAAEDRYRDALDKDLPPDIREMVDRQYRGVRENLARVRALEGTTGGAAPRDLGRETPPL